MDYSEYTVKVTVVIKGNEIFRPFTCKFKEIEEKIKGLEVDFITIAFQHTAKTSNEAERMAEAVFMLFGTVICAGPPTVTVGSCCGYVRVIAKIIKKEGKRTFQMMNIIHEQNEAIAKLIDDKYKH